MVWRLCRLLPLAVEPASGRLGPAGSPDSSTTIAVSLAPTEPGATVSELSISRAGGKEPLLCPLGASVVQGSHQLIDDATKTAVTEVCRHSCHSVCVFLSRAYGSSSNMPQHIIFACDEDEAGCHGHCQG